MAVASVTYQGIARYYMKRAVRAMLKILPCTDRDLTHVLCEGRKRLHWREATRKTIYVNLRNCCSDDKTALLICAHTCFRKPLKIWYVFSLYCTIWKNLSYATVQLTWYKIWLVNTGHLCSIYNIGRQTQYDPTSSSRILSLYILGRWASSSRVTYDHFYE